MISKESKQILDGIKNTNYGRALKELVTDALQEIGDVENCTTWQETQGRKLSKKFLKKLFSFLDSDPKSEKTKNPYE